MNVNDICKKNKIDIFEQALKIAISDKDEDSKFKKLMDLIPYVHAKVKEEASLSNFTPEQIREYVLGLSKIEKTRDSGL